MSGCGRPGTSTTGKRPRSARQARRRRRHITDPKSRTGQPRLSPRPGRDRLNRSLVECVEAIVRTPATADRRSGAVGSCRRESTVSRGEPNARRGTCQPTSCRASRVLGSAVRSPGPRCAACAERARAMAPATGAARRLAGAGGATTRARGRDAPLDIGFDVRVDRRGSAGPGVMRSPRTVWAGERRSAATVARARRKNMAYVKPRRHALSLAGRGLLPPFESTEEQRARAGPPARTPARWGGRGNARRTHGSRVSRGLALR